MESETALTSFDAVIGAGFDVPTIFIENAWVKHEKLLESDTVLVCQRPTSAAVDSFRSLAPVAAYHLAHFVVLVPAVWLALIRPDTGQPRYDTEEHGQEKSMLHLCDHPSAVAREMESEASCGV